MPGPDAITVLRATAQADYAWELAATIAFAYQVTADATGRIAYATHDTVTATAFLLTDAKEARKIPILLWFLTTFLGRVLFG